jgi:hypothetical protein
LGRSSHCATEGDAVRSRPFWQFASESIKNTEPHIPSRDNANLGQFLWLHNEFCLCVWGGVDYNFTGKLSWRVQADYLEIGIPNRTLNNVRVSTGIVFHS